MLDMLDCARVSVGMLAKSRAVWTLIQVVAPNILYTLQQFLIQRWSKKKKADGAEQTLTRLDGVKNLDQGIDLRSIQSL